MAITDNEGNPIDLSSIELSDAGEATQDTPNTEWNEGKPMGGEVGEDGKIIPPAEDPVEPETSENVEGKEEVNFEERTGDLVDGEQPTEDATEFYKGLGGILEEKGLMSLGEDGIQSEEQFLEAYEKEITSRLDARNKAVEEYMNAGVPYGVVSKIEKAIAETENISETDIAANEELSKNLILSEFQQRGFDNETASRYYNMFKDSGKATEEAMKALTMRKANLQNMLQGEIDKANKAKQDSVSAEDLLAKNLVKSIEKGEMLGRKITKPTQEKLKTMLNTVVGYTDSGQPLNALMKFKMENPVEFEKNLLYLYTVTGGFSNLGALDRSAETRVSRKFQNAVSNISSGKSFTERSSTPSKTNINMDDIDDIV